MFIHRLRIAALAAVGLAIAVQSTPVRAADLVWTESQTGAAGARTVTFNGSSGAITDPGLGARITYALTSVSADRKIWTFGYEIENISFTPIIQSRITSFGFDSTPGATVVSSTGAFPNSGLNVSIPGELGYRNVCFNLGPPGDCTGSATGGVANGGDVTGTFALNFDTSIGAVSLGDLFVRYQSVMTSEGALHDGLAIGAPVLISRTAGLDASATPEPAAWSLMILGVGGIGATLRRVMRPATTPLIG